MHKPVALSAVDERRDSLKEDSTSDPAHVFVFWFLAALGTLLAGCVFGLIEGGCAGLFLGPIYAGFFGTQIISTIAVLSWACWLNRFSVLMATAAGALTGVLSAALCWEGFYMLSYGSSIYLAGTIGAVGSGLFSGLYAARHNGWRLTLGFAQPEWRYSLQELFIRFTVVAVLIAVWTPLAKMYFKEWFQEMG